MFVGIMTKYVGPTNTKGSRIIAKDRYGSLITCNYNEDWSLTRNHEQAAIKGTQKRWPHLVSTRCSSVDWKNRKTMHIFEIR